MTIQQLQPLYKLFLSPPPGPVVLLCFKCGNHRVTLQVILVLLWFTFELLLSSFICLMQSMLLLKFRPIAVSETTSEEASMEHFTSVKFGCARDQDMSNCSKIHIHLATNVMVSCQLQIEAIILEYTLLWWMDTRITEKHANRYTVLPTCCIPDVN